MILNPILPIYILVVLLALSVIAAAVCVINKKHRKVKNFIRISIVALIVMALFRPMVPFESRKQEAHSNIVLFFVIDDTGSMAVEDEDGGIAREEAMKQDIKDIINSFEAPRIAFFTQDAVTYRMMPATSDVKTALNLAENLRAKATKDSEGTNLAKLFTEAANYMNTYLEADKDAEFVVFLMSDGENAINSTTNYEIKDSSFQNATYGAVVGYGSEEGGKVPNIVATYDKDNGIISYHRDTGDPFIRGQNNEYVISSINEDFLKKTAQSYNFTYTKTGNVKSLLSEARKKTGDKLIFEEAKDSTNAFELYWIFMMLVIVLLLIEFARDFNSMLAEREAKK